MLQVPVPPLPKVGEVSVSVSPAQTVVVNGDIVVVGGEGSATTVKVAVLLVTLEQPLTVELTTHRNS